MSLGILPRFILRSGYVPDKNRVIACIWFRVFFKKYLKTRIPTSLQQTEVFDSILGILLSCIHLLKKGEPFKQYRLR